MLADLSTNDTLIVCTAITALPATIAAVIGVLNRRQIQTPSGDTIGHVVERTHDLAAASVAHTTMLINGDTAETKEGS